MKIIVEDNGDGVSKVELDELIKSLYTGDNIGHNGICNVHQRIFIRYQNGYGLKISSEKYVFFRNEIILPIGKAETEVSHNV